MTEETTAVQIRMRLELRNQAEQVFKSIGLNFADGVRLYLQQVVNSGGLPFQPTAKPNVEEELKRLQRIIKADQTFAAMRHGHYTEG